jgi:hypothetical protein
VIGDGTDLASSTEFAVFDPGLVFGTEDAVDFGALDIIINSDSLTDESLVYGTILTDVDTGLGLTFDKGIKLGDSGILGDLTYTTTNGKVTITDCDNVANGELVIPDTIEGNPVISIGDNAFGDCENLTSITIPESVTSIGIRAFWSCTSLASITIPESVTTIDDNAFAFCSKLTNVSIPGGVTLVGKGAFIRCSSLINISVDEENLH